MGFLIQFIVNAILVCLVVTFVPGFDNTHGGSGMGAYTTMTYVWLAIIFGVVNAIIGPILRLLSLPLTWITHGLFTVVINWILLAMAVRFTGGLEGQWWANLIGAIVLMIATVLIGRANADRTTAS